MTLEIHVRRGCTRCEGDGRDPEHSPAPCGRCDGTGKEIAWMTVAELTSHVTVEQTKRARLVRPDAKP